MTIYFFVLKSTKKNTIKTRGHFVIPVHYEVEACAHPMDYWKTSVWTPTFAPQKLYSWSSKEAWLFSLQDIVMWFISLTVNGFDTHFWLIPLKNLIIKIDIPNANIHLLTRPMHTSLTCLCLRKMLVRNYYP